jgi:hypothetical protein
MKETAAKIQKKRTRLSTESKLIPKTTALVTSKEPAAAKYKIRMRSELSRRHIV